MNEGLIMDDDLINSMTNGVSDYLHSRMQEAIKSNEGLASENMHAALTNTLTCFCVEYGIEREWLLETVGRYYDVWERNFNPELND
jgi:hypothetical protein